MDPELIQEFANMVDQVKREINLSTLNVQHKVKGLTEEMIKDIEFAHEDWMRRHNEFMQENRSKSKKLKDSKIQSVRDFAQSILTEQSDLKLMKIQELETFITRIQNQQIRTIGDFQ